MNTGSRTVLAAGGRRSRNLPPYIWVTVGGTTLLIGYGYYSCLDTVPVTERRRWIATNPEWERQLGDEEYRKLLKMYRTELLPPSHPASLTVHRVGSRIAQASYNFASKYQLPSTTSHNKKIPFTYQVVRSDVANAFVLPGNHVFVTTGLFRFVRNEDDLAAVLAHEAAHNLARHAGEKVSGSLVSQLLARLLLVVDPSGVLLTFWLPAATVFRELPNSRTQESEADRIGLQLAAEACFDPKAASRVFRGMQQYSGDKEPPEFLSTHPSHTSRLEQLQEWTPEAMRIFQKDDRCRQIRKEMELARRVAALRTQRSGRI